MWKKPTFIIDTDKVVQNIDLMLRKADENNTILRPHFKTHQSAKIGKLFRERGISNIAVSSVSMARFFASDGWKDITIAFPLNLCEIDEMNELGSTITLNLLVESTYSIKFLADHIAFHAGIFIKIDTGYHRTGIDAKNLKDMEAILLLIESSEHLHFKGFLVHAGHTYQARSTNEVRDIGTSSIAQLQTLKSMFADDYPQLITSFGDTPSCSIMEDLSGIDELRPGNFVYYDVMQMHIGSCNADQIAVAVACPVVAIHKDRNEMVVYGGAVHLSKEYLPNEDGSKNYGLMVRLHDNGWSEPIQGANVSSLSQEHGIVRIPDSHINKFKPGDVIGILPVHSCLTANLLKEDMYFL
ncbi:MAG: alanine racemase [Bacteroidetes bacterium]|nr:alanine racemase [Bacteroidota bacterium]